MCTTSDYRYVQPNGHCVKYSYIAPCANSYPGQVCSETPVQDIPARDRRPSPSRTSQSYHPQLEHRPSYHRETEPSSNHITDGRQAQGLKGGSPQTERHVRFKGISDHHHSADGAPDSYSDQEHYRQRRRETRREERGEERQEWERMERERKEREEREREREKKKIFDIQVARANKKINDRPVVPESINPQKAYSVKRPSVEVPNHRTETDRTSKHWSSQDEAQRQRLRKRMEHRPTPTGRATRGPYISLKHELYQGW